MKNRRFRIYVIIILLCVFLLSGCGKRQSATVNEKMNRQEASTEVTTEKESNNINEQQPSEPTLAGDTASLDESDEEINPNAITKESSVYNCDIAADKASFDGKVDITVGDHFYATQINDWYMYFDQYEGKVVEIEGYYIGEFQPYDFVGRYGPVCPYCNGGYVSFEILSDEDLTQYQSEKDWIKVTGILRKGKDEVAGDFYYIEALKIDKQDQVGMDTVTD